MTKKQTFVEEEAKIRKMLASVADDMEVAIDAYMQHPRTCGIALRDAEHNRVWYPSLNGSRVTDETMARAAHIETASAWVTKLRNGIFSRTIEKSEENTFVNRRNRENAVISPKTYIDKVRGALRNQQRFDCRSLITDSFGLMRGESFGPEKEDKYTKAVFGQPLPKYREYRYVALKLEELNNPDIVHPALLNAVKLVSHSIREVFDEACVMLISNAKLKPNDIKFLKWISARNGLARPCEVAEWLTANNMPGGGRTTTGPSDPATMYLRRWCVKTAGPHSREPWKVRPESLELLKKL